MAGQAGTPQHGIEFCGITTVRSVLGVGYGALPVEIWDLATRAQVPQ
jgi:hypothetical protein